jgi:hypothetical protein
MWKLGAAIRGLWATIGNFFVNLRNLLYKLWDLGPVRMFTMMAAFVTVFGVWWRVTFQVVAYVLAIVETGFSNQSMQVAQSDTSAWITWLCDRPLLHYVCKCVDIPDLAICALAVCGMFFTAITIRWVTGLFRTIWSVT